MTEQELLLTIAKQKHDIELLKIMTDNLAELFVLHLRSGGHVGGHDERDIKIIEETLISTSEYLTNKSANDLQKAQ